MKMQTSLVEAIESQCDDYAAVSDYNGLGDLLIAAKSLYQAVAFRHRALIWRINGRVETALECEKQAEDAMANARALDAILGLDKLTNE